MTTTLKELPIERVKPDPNNPRKGKLDVADLMKSIAEIGLIEPIVVRPVGGEYVVVAGHRRLEAMKKLKDWTTITALVVTDYNEIGALRDALAENTVRKALSPMDEANAIVQLSGLGMTDAEIAASFAFDAKKIAAAETISEASEKGAKALKDVKPADGVQLTIEQSAAIARFGGTSAGRSLVAEIESGSRYWRRAYDKLVLKEFIDASVKAVTQAHKGVKKVPSHAGTWEGPEKSVEPLVNLTDAKGKNLTTAAHKGCPGHAYSIERPGTMWGTSDTKVTVAYWCTDWKAHGHKVSATPKRTWQRRGKNQQQVGAKGPSEAVLAEERALDAAWPEAIARRQVFIDEFLAKPKTGDKWTHEALAIALCDALNLDDGWEKLTLKALVPEVIRTYVQSRQDNMHDWRWSYWNKTNRIEFLNFLVENGYELSEVEQNAVKRAEAGVEYQTRQGDFVVGEDDDESDWNDED